MAHEEKNSDVKDTGKEGASSAKAALKILVGGIVVVLGILAVVVWWRDLLTIVKGGIGLFLIMAGAIIIAIAKE